jgi:hypothetical protein
VGYVKRRTKNGFTLEKWSDGFGIKVLTSKADPQIDGILEFLCHVERTKDLKTLNIKRDGLLLCLTNIHRNGDPEKKETGADSIKTMSIPLNF